MHSARATYSQPEPRKLRHAFFGHKARLGLFKKRPTCHVESMVDELTECTHELTRTSKPTQQHFFFAAPPVRVKSVYGIYGVYGAYAGTV